MPSKRIADRNILVICISGYAGSGKSTLAQYLKEKGFCIISADELGHRALSIAKEEIKNTFGSDVVSKTGDILRQKLREKLKTEEDWRKLEQITHPVILKLLREELERSKKKICFVDVAIPFTTGIYRICNVMIKVDAPIKVLKKRLLQRGLNKEFIENVLKKQSYDMNREYDYIIENNNEDLNYFLEKAYRIIQKIIKSYRLKIS